MKTLSLLKSAIACAIFGAALLGQANTDFYLTTSGTDGTGSGTSAGDPFVAASTNSYTWVLTNKQPNYTFHYAPGTYETRGWASGFDTGSETRRTAHPGCKHLGTNGVVVKLVGASYPGGNTDGIVFALNYWNEAADGFEVRDMTIDCNAQNQPRFIADQYGQIAAINVSGSDIIISNVTIKGFGVKQREGFPLYWSTGGSAWDTNAFQNYSNVKVEKVTFTLPATNNTDGITCCLILPGLGSTLSNSLVTNCTVSNVESDFRYSHGFTAPRVENSRVDGCAAGVYLEPGNPAEYFQDFVFLNNYFTNVYYGVGFMYSSTTNTDYPKEVRSMVVVSNYICLKKSNDALGIFIGYLYDTNTNAAPPTFAPKIESFIGAYNTIVFPDTNGVLNWWDSKGFSLVNISNACVCNNLINLGPVPNAITVFSNNVKSVEFFSIYENRMSNSFLLPITDGSGSTFATQQKGDFNLDGKPDIMWHNTSTGVNQIWFMGSTNGSYASTNRLSTGNITNAGAAWWPEGVGDFNGDGLNDFIVRNHSTGSNVMWIMGGTIPTNVVQVIRNLPTLNVNWDLAGVNDFNGDGMNDVLWRYQGANGTNMVWLMNGTSIMATNYLPSQSNVSWQIGGTGDFDGDASPDLAWRFYGTGGGNAVWYMDGTNYLGAASLLSLSDTGWHMQGVADFNMDAKPDLIWRYYGGTPGADAFWLMDGTNRLQSVSFNAVADTAWQIVGPK